MPAVRCWRPPVARRTPLIENYESADALVNDPALTQRVSVALKREHGADRVTDQPPEMASEDFAQFQKAGVPTLQLRVGATPQAVFDAAVKSGTTLPSLHSPLFAPDRDKMIRAAVAAGVIGLRELMPAR